MNVTKNNNFFSIEHRKQRVKRYKKKEKEMAKYERRKEKASQKY